MRALRPLALLAALPEPDREGLIRQALAYNARLPWVPNPGPQTEAYVCEADELLFGRLTEGGRLTVSLDDKEEVQLDIQPLPKKESRSSKSEPAEPEEAEAS